MNHERDDYLNLYIIYFYNINLQNQPQEMTKNILNQTQKKALSNNDQKIPEYIWNNKMAHIYPDFIQDNLYEDGQTFNEFLQMENRQPNEQGTGRYKFTKFNKISFIFIPKVNSQATIPKSVIPKIQKLISLYLNIPTYHKKTIKMHISNNKIQDKKRNLQYTIKTYQKTFDAYDILDVLMEYKQQAEILVALLEFPLNELKEPIYGRATGDGVAVVSYEGEEDFIGEGFQGFFQCMLHEILHTLGFDHCRAWRCQMNAVNTFTSWLCPACSRKLYYELNLTTKEEVKKWLSDLLQAFLELKYMKTNKQGRRILQTFTKSSGQ